MFVARDPALFPGKVITSPTRPCNSFSSKNVREARFVLVGVANERRLSARGCVGYDVAASCPKMKLFDLVLGRDLMFLSRSALQPPSLCLSSLLFLVRVAPCQEVAVLRWRRERERGLAVQEEEGFLGGGEGEKEVSFAFRG